MNVFDKDLMSIQETRDLIKSAKQAQEEYKNFSQEQIDKIVQVASEAVEKESVKLAKMAWEETGFGKWQDKVIKNKFASKYVYENIKNLKTVGIINENKESKFFEVAVPVGVIAALIPSTNPTSTAIYKILISLKTGNGIVVSPHPNAKNSTLEAVEILRKASEEAGAPKGLIGCIKTPSIGATNELMKHNDTSLILATGGEAMVRAAYSSGTPAIGVGPGNGPAFIDKSANVPLAVKRILDSKTFDNGVICASEQSIVVEKNMKDVVIRELKKQGAHFLNEEESKSLGKVILGPSGTMNPKVVGKSVEKIASMVGLNVPSDAKVLISEQNTVSHQNPYSMEKLAPILAFYVVENIEEAVTLCTEILMNEGKGHTMVLHCNSESLIREFGLKMPVSRVLINTPGALGGIGATTGIMPALTLGCGAVGKSSTSDNVGPMNLINIRRVAYGIKEIEEIKEEAKEEISINKISPSDEYIDLIINKVVEKLYQLKNNKI